MTAPIASGWSGCRVGLAPTGKRRLCTAHTQVGHRGPLPPSVSGYLIWKIEASMLIKSFG
jgi:hypothetical protein